MIQKYYIDIAGILIPLSFLIMIAGLIWESMELKNRKIALSLLAYILIISIGESDDIAHAYFDGSWIPFDWLNALLLVISAFFIATSAVRYIKSKFAYCLFVPCFLVLLVFVNNLQYQGMGLHIFGTWIY